MSLLLDTHVVLWFLANDTRLSAAARAAITDLDNVRWVSPISLMEIAIKHNLGKLSLPEPFGEMFPASLLAADMHLLPIEPAHIEPLATLPRHHNAPFDRLLVATAITEGLELVSIDSTFDRYGVARLW